MIHVVISLTLLWCFIHLIFWGLFLSLLRGPWTHLDETNYSIDRFFFFRSNNSVEFAARWQTEQYQLDLYDTHHFLAERSDGSYGPVLTESFERSETDQFLANFFPNMQTNFRNIGNALAVIFYPCCSPFFCLPLVWTLKICIVICCFHAPMNTYQH